MSTVKQTVYLQSPKTSVFVKTGPKSTYQTRGVTMPSMLYTSSKHDSKTGYYYIDNLKGWVDGSKFTITDANPRGVVSDIPNKNIVSSSNGAILSSIDGNGANINDQELYVGYINSGDPSDTSNTILANNMNDILGMPYQFPGHVDRKIGNSTFGRKYTERIVSNMPLLLLTPGKCVFMSEAEKSTRQSTFSKLVQDGLNINDTGFDDMIESYINKPTKYYTFKFDQTYYEYVDTILHSTAVLMGIGDVKVSIGSVKNKALKKFPWSKAANPLVKSFGQSAMNYVCLYVDAVTTKNESFSNHTMESQLASKVNSFSDTAKEIQFLLGEKAGDKFNAMSQDLVSEAQSTIDSIVKSTLGGNAIFEDLANQFSNVAMGGKILFPKIYQDSNYDQSFDFEMKLRCPNPTPLNWYLDIMRPLAYIYALTLPRATEGNNGYRTPYIVRGFYKNICNIDMGIISGVSVSKGKEGSFTPEGYPTEVDVSITIEDLYNVLFMSKMTTLKNCKGLITNDQYMSFLANQVGVNLNQADLERTINMYRMIATNYFIQKPTYWKNKVVSSINNKILSMYKGPF